MEDTYRRLRATLTWLFPVEGAYSAEELQEIVAQPSSLTCTRPMHPDLGPTCQPLSNGASAARTRDVEIFSSVKKRFGDLIDGMFATLIQATNTQGSILVWTKPII